MLEEYKEQLKNIFYNKNNLLVLGLVVVFIVLAIYIYREYVVPRMNPSYVANKEFTSQGEQDGGDSDVADLYLFYTTWCPHCKTTKPIWEKLKNKVGNSGVKGVKINFIEIDCDKDKDTANKFKVEGYPTIKMVHNNQVIEYDAKPNLETLMQFLETSL
jgi:thiol-disulfide isomerase/thioredoxin